MIKRNRVVFGAHETKDGKHIPYIAFESPHHPRIEFLCNVEFTDENAARQFCIDAQAILANKENKKVFYGEHE